MSNATRVSLILAAATSVGVVSSASADSAVINFTTNLTSYEGPAGVETLSPFVPGTALNALVNGLDGFAGLGSPDWLRFSGQIYIPDYTGPGTYSITPDNGVGGIYLHSPLLNRLEAVSLRTEGPLTQASIDAGAGRADGNATQNRDDIYLPDFTPNAVTTVTITPSNEVTIDYDLDFSTLSDENAGFLRDGVTPTQISVLLEDAGQKFGFIGVDGTGVANVQSAIIGSGDEDDFAYGGFSLFETVVEGNLSNTIVPTTRGVIDNEVAAMNISSDGRSTDPTTDTVFLTDPFAGESGETFFFDLTGGPDFFASAQLVLVPEPTTATLGLLALGGLLRRRR
ncbi:MAG: MYXO-CTERM sorting domain-containing protein [Planctomycetota bacterium]